MIKTTTCDKSLTPQANRWKMSSNLFFDMNPLDNYFVNQSHNPGKLTFVNASFWEKRTAIHKPRRPFNFDFKAYPPRTILREVSRVSSLILRAKPWLAKKVLRHGNRFAARVRKRYFSEEEKRWPEIRLLFAGYHQIWCAHAIVVQQMHACAWKMPSCCPGLNWHRGGWTNLLN